MRPREALVAAALAAGVAAASAQAPAPPSPCGAPEHRAFDFWIGEWTVLGPRGGIAGSNSIRVEHGGCVLRERYDTGRGYSGESLNAYDASRKVWHQTWVDSAGLLLTLEGGPQRGGMVLEGRTVDGAGAVTRHRISWTPNADGTVRQHWESAGTSGDWKTVFDGTYVRR